MTPHGNSRLFTLFTFLVAPVNTRLARDSPRSHRAAIDCLRTFRGKTTPVGPGFIHEHRYACCFKFIGYRGSGNPGTVTVQITLCSSRRASDGQLTSWTVVHTLRGALRSARCGSTKAQPAALQVIGLVLRQRTCPQDAFLLTRRPCTSWCRLLRNVNRAAFLKQRQLQAHPLKKKLQHLRSLWPNKHFL